MEQKSRNSQVAPKVEKGRFFSVARGDGAKHSTNSSPGITIQIRLKGPAPAEPGRLLTRQNTEFWLSAND